MKLLLNLYFYGLDMGTKIKQNDFKIPSQYISIQPDKTLFIFSLNCIESDFAYNLEILWMWKTPYLQCGAVINWSVFSKIFMKDTP